VLPEEWVAAHRQARAVTVSSAGRPRAHVAAHAALDERPSVGAVIGALLGQHWDYRDNEPVLVAALFRDVAGNPFSPSPPLSPAVLAWCDGTVRKLARAIHEERAFERLPILADALEEAGCVDQYLLAHCRSPGPHVFGCWAVDHCLGRD
jgi:hypothetical protein